VRSRAKVTIDSLKSYVFRGRIKVMSTIALHSPLNISETVRVEAWFQRTTNRKWPTGNEMVTWPMTSRDPERSNSLTRDPEYTLIEHHILKTA